jgi:adenine deaminase
VLQAACINPIDHYSLKVGRLRAGDPADFITINNLEAFSVTGTYIDGIQVAGHGTSLISRAQHKIVNNFTASPVKASDFIIKATGAGIRVIEALDGQLITNELQYTPLVAGGNVVTDVERDILKVAVVNRYTAAPPAIAFIKNFNLKRGAIASSVAHDSHNIIAVGVDDESIARAVNMIIEARGGVAAVDKGNQRLVALPVAGIMSAADGYTVAREYKEIDRFAKAMGSTLSAPFMTLSFMALLVIPALKLSDKGLFDGEEFAFKEVFL